MNEINLRIREIFAKTQKSQSDFAREIHVTPAYIWKILNKDDAVPSERLINDICEKFAVRKEWLCTGEGEMFATLSEEDEYMKAATEISVSGDTFAMRVIVEYWKLDEESKKVFRDFLSKL